MKRDVYSGRLKLNGEEHPQTLIVANNYANSLCNLNRYAEAKSLLRKTTPVARRNFGESSDLTLQLRANYAAALYIADDATLDDLREAVATLEDAGRIARRVLGGAHPFVVRMVRSLQQARAALSAREGDVEPLREAVAAMTPGDAQDGPMCLLLLLRNPRARVDASCGAAQLCHSHSQSCPAARRLRRLPNY